jgi:hypothetical protein
MKSIFFYQVKMIERPTAKKAFLTGSNCGKIVIKAGRSQLEPFGVFLLIKRRLSFLTSYSMLYLYLLFCD